MTPQRVTLITLAVTDLAASRALYGSLGWTPQQEAEGVAFYRMDGMALALFDRQGMARDQGRAAATLGTGAITLAQNFPDAADVDRAFAAAIAAGATALKPPAKAEWGGYSGYWSDPDGHVWEMAMNPFWPLTADGRLTLP